jgi:hypothetical protein
VFGSEAWAHILDEKRKALQPKSEKCIFVGYSEDVKDYRLRQPHSNEIIIRREVKFDKNLSTYEPNLLFVTSSAYEPSLTSMPSSLPNFFVSDPIMVSCSNNDSDNENPPPLAHLPLLESIEDEPTPTPLLPRWVHTTREVGAPVHHGTTPHIPSQ